MGGADPTGCLHSLFADLPERSLLVLKKLLLLLLLLKVGAIVDCVFGSKHALKGARLRHLAIAGAALSALCELLILRLVELGEVLLSGCVALTLMAVRGGFQRVV